MSAHFADRLIEKIDSMHSPCIVGLDLHEEGLPDFVADELRRPTSPQRFEDAVVDYFTIVLDAVCDVVPAVKPQCSLLERFTWVGAKVLVRTITEARSRGLIVVADAKRSDIASSAVGYARAFLGAGENMDWYAGYGADAMTVNGFLGEDSIRPFVDVCAANGTGLFVLVKTSNPGSVLTQDRELSSGGTIAQMYAGMVDKVGRAVVGKNGYSSIGAVIGATFPEQALELRKLMPQAIILVPGYGTQGGGADDVVPCFDSQNRGAIVNASRSITHKSPRLSLSPREYAQTVSDNARRMVDDIGNALQRRRS